MLFTTYFNCPDCKRPFDVDKQSDEYERFPVAAPRSKKIRCRVCDKNPKSIAQKGLISYLAWAYCFTEQQDGHEYERLPQNSPNCSACDRTIPLSSGDAIYRVECGHYFCKGCIERPEASCLDCGIKPNRSAPPFKDTFLAKFYNQPHLVRAKHFDKLKEGLAAKEEEIKEMTKKLEAISDTKEKDRGSGALKGCVDCGVDYFVERLFKCDDCTTIVCGNCFFDSHREHSVVKLLGIELIEMEAKGEKRYTENLEGLHGNLKYLHKAIDEAVEKVVIAGKERLTQVKGCTKYGDAKDIVTTIDKAADEFEKRCEVYIPVARQLATRLTELSENLIKKEPE